MCLDLRLNYKEILVPYHSCCLPSCASYLGNNAEMLNIYPVIISPVYISFSLILSWTIEDMVIRLLSILCFIMDDLLTRLWVFNMSWDSCSRSGRCVGSGYQVGGGFVGHGYPVGGGYIWFFSLSSSPCSTVSFSPLCSEIIIIGFGDTYYCWEGMSLLDAPSCWDKFVSGWGAPPGLEIISSLDYTSWG